MLERIEALWPEASPSRPSFAMPPPYLELLPIAAYACDRAGRILWYNKRAADLWGRSPLVGDDSELYCGSHRLIFGGREIGRDETPMAHVLRTGEAVDDAEGIVIRPDGTEVHAMVHISPIRDEAGEVVGAINCFHDTTELRRLDRELKATEERYRRIIEALPAAIYTTTADGTIDYYNQAAVEMAGVTPVVGQSMWCVSWRLQTADGKPLPHDECPMAVALRENRPVRNVEIMVERPDGSVIPALPHPVPLRDAGGRLVGAVNMIVDISERKQAENRQIMLLRELNHRVKNNMQLLHALLNTAANDCRSEEAATVLKDAVRRVAAMAAAQRVLYDERAPTALPARQFLDAVCTAAGSGLRPGLAIEIEQAAGVLTNDRTMPLALIVNELVLNAAKHGLRRKESGTIRVGLVEDGGPFDLWVRDEGPGFDLGDVLARRSSGLGLVQGLARQLGGTLSVRRDNGAICSVHCGAGRQDR